jgi:Fic family protein
MMAYLGKKKVGGKSFYYLEQSFRLNGSVHKREKFIGEFLPKDIAELKRQFSREVRAELAHPRLDEIKKGFAAEERSLPASVREKVHQSFTVRFTYDTNRIEGSTLSLRETADLLDHNITPSKRPLSDVLEAEAHQDVFRKMLKTKKDLSLRLILDWHYGLFGTTKADIAGRLRNYQVYISGAKHLPPSPVEVYPLLMEMFKWYDRNKRKLHPVELAAILHLKFESIHPFGDGNGRIGRLMGNFILHRNGWPMLNIPYEKRQGYYNALERSQTRQDEDVFIQWFFRRYLMENARYRR